MQKFAGTTVSTESWCLLGWAARRTLRLSGVTNRGEKFGRSRNLVPGEETCKVMRLKVGQQRDLRR